MNRRIFFVQIPLLMNKRKTTKIQNIEFKQTKENDIVYISKNKKLVSQSIYEDDGMCLTISNYVQWMDPVSNTIMNKKDRTHFILESDNL